jgi:hypothetical protein
MLHRHPEPEQLEDEADEEFVLLREEDPENLLEDFAELALRAEEQLELELEEAAEAAEAVEAAGAKARS